MFVPNMRRDTQESDVVLSPPYPKVNYSGYTASLEHTFHKMFSQDSKRGCGRFEMYPNLVRTDTCHFGGTIKANKAIPKFPCVRSDDEL